MWKGNVTQSGNLLESGIGNAGYMNRKSYQFNHNRLNLHWILEISAFERILLNYGIVYFCHPQEVVLFCNPTPEFTPRAMLFRHCMAGLIIAEVYYLYPKVILPLRVRPN
jgi:hypothetical protein